MADGLRDKEDLFLLFFMERIEPVYKALETADMQLLFDTLGVRRYPIIKKIEKVKWKTLKEHLAQVRTEKSIDVLKVAIESQLIQYHSKFRNRIHAILVQQLKNS